MVAICRPGRTACAVSPIDELRAISVILTPRRNKLTEGAFLTEGLEGWMTVSGWLGQQGLTMQDAPARACAPGVGYFPLKSLGHWRGVPRDCAVLIFEWELSYSVACGREVTRRRLSCSRLRGGRVGRALHGAGAEGVTAQRVDRMERHGVTRRSTIS
jgi:hypothetical protein